MVAWVGCQRSFWPKKIEVGDVVGGGYGVACEREVRGGNEEKGESEVVGWL